MTHDPQTTTAIILRVSSLAGNFLHPALLRTIFKHDKAFVAFEFVCVNISILSLCVSYSKLPILLTTILH
jgi:hypothetical protein